MSYRGEWQVGDTAIFWLFDTTVNGTPTSLAGSPAVSVYKNNTTERAEASALTVDYDGRVGMNQILIDTSASGAFYAPDNFFDVVFTAGTLGGVSVVGRNVGAFSLTTKATNVNKSLNAVARGTVTTGSSTTSVTTSAFTIANTTLTAVADQYKDKTILFDGDTTTVGLRGAAKNITANTSSATPTFTVAALPATPVSGDTFSII